MDVGSVTLELNEAAFNRRSAPVQMHPVNRKSRLETQNASSADSYVRQQAEEGERCQQEAKTTTSSRRM